MPQPTSHTFILASTNDQRPTPRQERTLLQAVADALRIDRNLVSLGAAGVLTVKDNRSRAEIMRAVQYAIGDTDLALTIVQ